MAKMKTAVIIFPGSTCDRDIQVALQQSGAMPIMVWHKEIDFEKVDLIVLPGGFSFGDKRRCGLLAAYSPVMQEVINRAGNGVPILGICNGFQILIESGLLPGILIRNIEQKFICKNIDIKIETNQSIFTNRYRKGDRLQMPIAHYNGRYIATPNILSSLEENGQIAFRYQNENPNGSINNIAGIFNRDRTILGMMPHPERMNDPDGKLFFASLTDSLS